MSKVRPLCRYCLVQRRSINFTICAQIYAQMVKSMPNQRLMSRCRVKAGSSRLPSVDLMAIRALGRMPISGHSPVLAIDPMLSASPANQSPLSGRSAQIAGRQAGQPASRRSRGGIAAEAAARSPVLAHPIRERYG